MIIKKINGSVAEARRQENILAEIERYKAYVDYIAMMSDVELPHDNKRTDDGGADDEGKNQ